MSQIISIFVGGAGNRIGIDFWQKLAQSKSQLNHEQLSYYNKFYSDKKSENVVPRAMFFDTDARTKDSVLKFKDQLHFNEDLIFGNGSSCLNLYAEGHYKTGVELNQVFVEKLRKQAEKCENLSGFLLCLSPCGGTGSGVGSNFLSQLRDYFCDKILEYFPILPGIDYQNNHNQYINPLSIYNIVLSTHSSIQLTDLIYPFENKAAQRTLISRGNIHTDYSLLNKYYSTCLNEHVHNYIEPGTLNTNPRKRAVNLVPFPRIKHLCGILNQPNSKDIVSSSLENKNKLMFHETAHDSRIYTMNVNVSDQFISENDIQKTIFNWKNSTQNKFVDWIGDPVHISMRRGLKNREEYKKNSWTLINGSNNIAWVKALCQMFTSLFRRKAFISHYTGLGMDELEFTQAQSNCNDLISQYQPCTGCYQSDQDYDSQFSRMQSRQ